jgi:DNA polymerase-4
LVPGIGPKTVARLEQMGLRTLAQLGEAEEQMLVERFGANHGRDLGRRARFEHDGRVSQERKVVSESRERTFDVDVSDSEDLRAHLRRMSLELCESLQRHQRRGRTIGIKVRLDDWTTVTRARTLPEATSDAELVAELALAMLAGYAPPRPVRLLGVRVAGLVEAGGAGVAAVREPEDQLALPV